MTQGCRTGPPAYVAGMYDNPMPQSTLSPQSGTMNCALGCCVAKSISWDFFLSAPSVWRLCISPTSKNKHCQRRSSLQSTHRVSTAAFWRTFHHDGKVTQAVGSLLVTITYKVAVYAQLSGQIHSPYFISTPIQYSVVFSLFKSSQKQFKSREGDK